MADMKSRMMGFMGLNGMNTSHIMRILVSNDNRMYPVFLRYKMIFDDHDNQKNWEYIVVTLW